MPSSPTPTPADVVRICAIDHRVIRNLEITACYAELSDGMRARAGDAANWCTFATWASRQAGSTIRGEDLLDRLQRRLRSAAGVLAPLESFGRMLLRRGLFQPGTRLGRLVAEIHTPFDAFERASAEVALGNLKVFEEIGLAFSDYLTRVPADAPAGGPEFVAFLGRLRPGPPPDGQDHLKAAFTCYQQLPHESDAAARASLLLLANLHIGLHEQTRLQPQIAAAVDAPLTTVRDLGRRVLHVLVPASERWPALLHDPAATLAGGAAALVRRVTTRITREVVTESMMVLALPHVVLALGRTIDAAIPPVFAGGPMPPLAALVAEYDPCANGVGDCAARDWCSLRERMHYIVHLFRAYATDPALFSPPFTAAQVATFRSGVVPEGNL